MIYVLVYGDTPMVMKFMVEDKGDSKNIICAKCGVIVDSRVEKRPGPTAITCRNILCMMCLWPLGICCIPMYLEVKH